MSALGQKQTWPWVSVMCALTSKADIDWHHSNVCFVPISLKKSGSKSEHRAVKLTARSTAGLICCQAGFRFGIGISFASLRRF
jgi:hypothetical protein